MRPTINDGADEEYREQAFGTPKEVLPCPFCGSTDLDVPREDYSNQRQTHCYLAVACHSRDSRMPASPEGRARWQATIAAGAREALALWNGRGQRPSVASNPVRPSGVA